jgi:hypothetical protein
MEMPDLNTLEHEWRAFLSAPYIIAPFMAGAGLIGWWLRGIKSARRIDGLEAESKLSDKRAAWANEARDEIARQFKDFKEEVAAAGVGKDELIARIEKLEAAVRSALTGALNATEGADIGGAVE